MIRSLRFWAGVAISALFIWLFFRATDLHEIKAGFREANYWYMAPAIAVLFVALAIRCYRWSVLMRPVAAIGPWRLFPYAIIGYMANNLLPARAGEVVRAYVTGERENVSRMGTFGTIAVERLFDGCALVLLLVGAGVFVGLDDPKLRVIAVASAALFLIAFTVFYILTLDEARSRRIIHWFLRFLPDRFEHQVEHMADMLVVGLRSVHEWRSLAIVIVLSLMAWMVEAAAYAIIGAGFNLGVGYGSYCLLLAAANLAIIIPTFLGGTGPFEWAAKLVLVGAGVADGLASAYAVVAHAVIFLPTTILGLILLWSFGINLRKVVQVQRPEEPAEVEAVA
ncbi:MAG TPA: lysylphosphatidylglycerol synthase transmembrane domain-containing protein [Tepidiformaceae bacterium]|nr:lysylphosphatidylglycerol synthase transmembrane domain-containing protein [Tepidiformaceae bacterium]